MAKILACLVLSKELRYLAPDCEIDFFEPLCHSFGQSKFVDYVASLIKDHSLLICGDCGGLAKLAKDKGLVIPASSDCIDMIAAGRHEETGTLYLTDGWLDNFDLIFGLERLRDEAREKVIRTLFSTMSRVIYMSTPGAKAREGQARELAHIIGCRFESIEGSLQTLSKALKGADL